MAAENYQYIAVGGSDIQVALEFPTLSINGQAATFVMASAITVSYSVYRAKSNVYNMGQPLLSGLSVGKKYVAGSMITVSYQVDEISNFINQYVASQQQATTNSTGQVSTPQISIQNQSVADGSLKNIYSYMRDDLPPFNIHFTMTDEYNGMADASTIIVYGAQFINNGQVMSIEDIITENTLSFIARDVREQTPLGQDTRNIVVGTPVITASSLLGL